jgi:hypothetical protein
MHRALRCTLLALLAATSCLADASTGVITTTTTTTLNRVRAPRGWNSYNGWGAAVNETVLLSVADFVQARPGSHRMHTLLLNLTFSRVRTDATRELIPRLCCYARHRCCYTHRRTWRSTATRTWFWMRCGAASPCARACAKELRKRSCQNSTRHRALGVSFEV